MRLPVLACACVLQAALVAGDEDLLRQGDMWYGRRANSFDSQTMEVDPAFISKL